MNSYKTSGVVIKRMNYGETDRILTILTERFGKIKAIAKGVRKVKSKMAGSLEPFLLVDLQLCEGKSFFIVTGSEIRAEFEKIHNDLKKTSKAYYLAELLDKFMQENQKSEKIFEIFVRALNSINKDYNDFLLRIFELRIIEASGFKPELHNCVHCKEKLSPGENFWDAVEGGVICADCQKLYHHGREISNDLIKIFRLIDDEKFELLERIKISEAIKNDAENILAQYLEAVLEREIKSKKFLKLININ